MTGNASAARLIKQAEAVVFDVEGTLVDAVPYVLESWRATLGAAGHAVTIDGLQRFSGMDGRDMLAKLIPGLSDAAINSLLKQQAARYKTEGLPRVKSFPEVRSLFESLRVAGKRVGLATDCSSDECGHYSRLANIQDVVDAGACGDEVRCGKPHPDLVRLVLDKLKVRPANAVIVGDTPFDIVAARTVGSAAIGVLTGGYACADLLDSGANSVVSEVWALLDGPEPSATSMGATVLP